MKPSMTANEVIRSWIKDNLYSRGEFTFSSVHIQVNVVEHGVDRLIYHTPDMYSREWRRIRENIKVYDCVYKFKVEEFFKKGSKVKWYRVTRS